MFIKIINTYMINFPNLQYQKGMCDTYGLAVEYEHSYFRRMFRWMLLHETSYVITHKMRGSQTS